MADFRGGFKDRFNLLALCVLSYENLRGSDIRVLVAILMRYNSKDQFSMPGIETIAKDALLSQRQVIRAIKRLAADDILSVWKNGRSNTYEPNWELVDTFEIPSYEQPPDS